MKRPPTRRRGIVRLATALILGPLALSAAGVVASPQRMHEWIGGESSSPEGLLEFHAGVRNLQEFVIVLLQLGSLAAFCLWKLAPVGRCADLGRNGFVAALVAMGMGGTLCAGYGSPFALYAGFTMAFLLILNAFGSGPPAVNPFRAAGVPVMISR